jgi:hypothetical protein
MRLPRIELGSTAWKATMLTITPETLDKTFCRTLKDEKVQLVRY